MTYDSSKVRAVPKPAKTPKKNSKAVEGADEKRKKQNDINRQFGKATERRVANKVGGQRIPMSGAIKTSNFNLTGDVVVRDHNNQPFAKLEIKGQSRTTAKGEKIFTIPVAVLQQAFKEAKEAGEIGCVVYHYKNDERDYFIFDGENIYELFRLAKLGILYESQIESDKA